MYVYLLQAMAFRHLQKRVQMSIMAVHAAVGQQSVQMQGRIILLRILHGSLQSLILEEISVLDLFRDPCQFLIYDTSGAHIHMAHLGVAHLSVRQSYCQAAGIPLYKGIFLHQFIHHRSLCLRYCICLDFVIQSITI